MLSIKHSLMFCAGALCLLSAVGAQADEKFFVQTPAIYDTGAQVPPAVWHECNLERHVGEQVFRHVSARFPGAMPLDKPGEPVADKYLKLTIVGVSGLGGGAWSGSKTIALRADVQQQGRELAMKVFTRSSRGGPFGGSSGTCAIMERITVALGKDVTAWLPGLIDRSPENTAAETARPQ